MMMCVHRGSKSAAEYEASSMNRYSEILENEDTYMLMLMINGKGKTHNEKKAAGVFEICLKY